MSQKPRELESMRTPCETPSASSLITLRPCTPSCPLSLRGGAYVRPASFFCQPLSLSTDS
eukprot:377542-Prymnesium_polylepis.1